MTRTETDPHRERDADVGLTGPILVKSMSGAGRLYAHSSGRVGHEGEHLRSTTCLVSDTDLPESPPILPSDVKSLTLGCLLGIYGISMKGHAELGVEEAFLDFMY